MLGELRVVDTVLTLGSDPPCAGVGGLTLGGGMGYLTRRHGLTIDNLLAADVVLADGTLVTADAEHHPDLFWALRGGGGNFGVVTAFEYEVHPVREVYGGPILFELGDAADVLRFYREFIRDAPEAFGGFPAWQIAPPLPFMGPLPALGSPTPLLIGFPELLLQAPASATSAARPNRLKL